jgi:cytochrome c6
MVLRIIPLFLLLASCGGKVEPVVTEEYLPETGKDLYNMHCVSCHGDDGALGSGAAANLMTSKLDDKAIKNMILNGNENGMMPYKDLLANDAEADSLVCFVRTLRK